MNMKAAIYSFSESISGNINLNHTRYTHLLATKYTVELIVTDTIKIKEYNKNNR